MGQGAQQVADGDHRGVQTGRQHRPHQERRLLVAQAARLGMLPDTRAESVVGQGLAGTVAHHPRAGPLTGGEVAAVEFVVRAERAEVHRAVRQEVLAATGPGDADGVTEDP